QGELRGGDLVLAQLEYRVGRAAPVAGDHLAGIPLWQVVGAPLARCFAGRALQKYRSPGRNRQSGVLAVGQALVPGVIEVGVVGGGAAGHQVTPELGYLLCFGVGQIDLDGLLTVEGERSDTGLPQVCDELAWLVWGDV